MGALTVGDPADDEDRPSGLPSQSSEKRRVSTDGELVSLRPPAESEPPESPRVSRDATPPGLGKMSTSARLRLELALDHDSDEIDVDAEADSPAPRPAKRPLGLQNMNTSARHRLELALEHDDEDIFDPTKPSVLARERISEFGFIPFDESARRLIGSLSRWIGFCAVITLAIGALTGLSYLTGEGSVAHVVAGILATAVSIWQVLAVWSLRKVLNDRQQQHHIVHALGHIRSALLLKALLVCAMMILGCFTFSIAGSLLFLLG